LTLEDGGYPFTVDLSGPTEVVINSAVQRRFTNAAGNQEFVPADKVTLETIAVVLPFCFAVGSAIPYVKLEWWQAAGQTTIAWYYTPVPDLEIVLRQYVDYTPFNSSANAEWDVGQLYCPVSMLGNVPTALDTTTQKVQVAVKIWHNFPMV
jgi:hypothetical protein